MKLRDLSRTLSLLLLLPLTGAGLFTLGGGCTTGPDGDGENVGQERSALTPAQCNYFDVNGKVQICHKTSSTTKPYTILRVSGARVEYLSKGNRRSPNRTSPRLAHRADPEMNHHAGSTQARVTWDRPER